MSFWDSSALFPLFSGEPYSFMLRDFARKRDEPISVWWGSLIECNSAISRKLRMGELDEIRIRKARENLQSLSALWREIEPDSEIRDEAIRLIHLYPLRAGDALQLAAAMIWANRHTESKTFVCLDDRLRDAARIEGFNLIPEKL